ncbi:MAG TPA: DUF4124 domain-containing protein [Rhodanobacteraceae bacterium]
MSTRAFSPLTHCAMTGALALYACGMPAHAGEYYKWKDSQGIVHVSRTPPVGRGAKIVSIDETAPVPPLPGASQAPQTGRKAGPQAALQKTDMAAVATNCTIARQNIARLQRHGMVVDDRNSTDTSHALTADERAKALAEARAQVARYCVKAKP